MSPPTNNASSYIQWQVIRKNSAFLKRQRGIPKTFSTEAFNPKKINSIRFNGLVNKKGVDVQLKRSEDNKTIQGIVLSVKKPKSVNKPAESKVSTTFTNVSDSRRVLKSVKKAVNSYKPAAARHITFFTSQYLRAVKPTTGNSAAAKTTTKSEA